MQQKFLNSEKGSLIVWLTGIIPILVVLALFFVNTVLMIDSKIRLQAAVDRGVYAGASYLSHVMNEVAQLNHKFRKEYLKKKKTFGTLSMDNSSWIKNQIKEMKNNQNAYLNQMNNLLDEGYERAHLIAADVTKINLIKMPHFGKLNYVSEYGSNEMFEMIDELKAGKYTNKDKLVPWEIKGTSYDPENYKKHIFEVRKYLIKSPEYFAAISSSVRVRFKPPFLTKYFTKSGSVGLGAIAAAQPYGGSIKEYAISDGNAEYLYHPAFIPVKFLVEDADVEH